MADAEGTAGDGVDRGAFAIGATAAPAMAGKTGPNNPNAVGRVGDE